MSASVVLALVVLALVLMALPLWYPDDPSAASDDDALASNVRAAIADGARGWPLLARDAADVADAARETPNAESLSQALQSLADSSAASALDAVASNDIGARDFRITVRSGVIERSLFADEKRLGAADPVLLKLSEIFGWDIDFPQDMREGDSFLVIYEDRYEPGRKTPPTILAAEYVNRGKVYRAIAFPVDGAIAYFTPGGKRLRRTFLRSPVDVSSVSSPFSKSRFHPILNVWRAHTGVDYAAAPGASVHATASGRVVSIGWNGGYGRTVVLQHLGAYSTLYGHLSRYRQGLEVGAEVAQGEVIGYVGQSGLATGPHLHYEFRVNGEHRDPMLFKPRENQDETIAPKLREAFFNVAQARTARLDLYSGRPVTLATQVPVVYQRR